MSWQIWIDVGGTFTDLVAMNPKGELQTRKVLSSGRFKGQIDKVVREDQFFDPVRKDDVENGWVGAELHIRQNQRQPIITKVTGNTASGILKLDRSLPPSVDGCHYEILSSQPAPVLAIRSLLGLRLDEKISPVELRLGTTRGTNALLERRGARTALLITAGFEDAVWIGNQSRPELFNLNIQRPAPLYEKVIGCQERIDAEGHILVPLDLSEAGRELEIIRAQKMEAIAICLLHAYRNPIHEIQLGELARSVGFTEISLSHQVSRTIKLINRGQTTLLNAYLNPILQSYLAEISCWLPGSQLELMTSTGGLLRVSQFQGKDSLLSGPAGGVIGFAQIAQQNGHEQAIGFDMGGTSTDVARFDGQHELTYESEIAGIPNAIPALKIETVAAGGGSICRFDGVRLLVGPESAGANPGPCCYGQNGPLTITDMNLVTGRILPAHFPFPLELQTVRAKLQAICVEIKNSSWGAIFSVEELAEGFLKIANARMARTIRQVSSARGFHPAEYTLVSFGGAGGQHACALARELQMKKVLIPAHASLLSAYGIGQAEREHHAEVSFLKAWQEVTDAEISSAFRELIDQQMQSLPGLSAESKNSFKILQEVTLRYQGQNAVIPFAWSAGTDYALLFPIAHEKAFGYRLDQQRIEVASLRIKLTLANVGTRSSKSFALSSENKSAAIHVPLNSSGPARSTTKQTAIYLNGDWKNIPVFTRSELSQEDTISGPALIGEPNSSYLLEPDFEATVTADASLLLTRMETPVARAKRDSAKNTVSRSDPVQLEVFHNRIASIAEQMGETLRLTSHSVNVKERLDYSCAVFDGAGELVANAPHIPVHLGAMSETVKTLIETHGPCQPGDVYVSNDPYQGGSHLPDVTVVTPIVDHQNSELIAVVAARAHHAEIGGITPGSMPPFSRNLAEEGVLISNFLLSRQGIWHGDELLNLLLSSRWPTRNVNENRADLMAQVSANQRGVNLMQVLFERFGTDFIKQQMQEIRQATAERTRLALSRLSQEPKSFVDFLDDGSRIKVQLQWTGEKLRVDFTGTDPVRETNLNANRAIVTSALMYVIRCLIDAPIPLNSGLLDHVELILPDCLLNPQGNPNPELSPAMVGGNVETSQRIVDVLLGALQLAAASQGTMNNLTFGDGEFGYYETICGGSGATSLQPGCAAVHSHMTNTRLTDVEILESRYPVRIRKFCLRPNSGGAGKHRGGDGIIRELEMLQPLQVSLLSQRRGPSAPYGINGGGAGQAGVNSLLKQGHTEFETLPGSFQVRLHAGDILRIETPGGGGWGVADLR